MTLPASRGVRSLTSATTNSRSTFARVVALAVGFCAAAALPAQAQVNEADLPPGAAAAANVGYGQPRVLLRDAWRGAFNVPDGASISSATPRIDDRGTVVLKVILIDGQMGAWVGGSGGDPKQPGRVIPATVFTGVGGDIAVADVVDPQKRDASVRVGWTQFESAQDGVYVADVGRSVDQVRPAPQFVRAFQNAQVWTIAGMDTRGHVIARGSTQQDMRLEVADTANPNAGATVIASTSSLDPKSEYSYLFTPTVTLDGRVAMKVRRGAPGELGDAQPDELRIFDLNGASVVVAQDRDADPQSPFIRFDNAMSVTPGGAVGFTAELDNGRAICLVQNGQTVVMALEGDSGIKSIESFAPAFSNAGTTFFRAVSNQGVRSLYVATMTAVTPLLSVGQSIETDLGKDTIAGFSGSPVCNGAGDIAVGVSLASGSKALLVIPIERARNGA